MTGLYLIFGGMILFASAVGIYDLLAERQARRRSGSQR
jgi:hypothetical protein